jgi:UDP-N-acetyl-D-mannosaminuronic acid transferase (WecB/TagA/CpsF family)
LRVIARIQNDSTVQISIYENFAMVTSARVNATVSTLAQGDLTLSSDGYGLVVSAKSEVRQLLNGDKIRLFPAEFLGLLPSGRSISGSLVCVALARTASAEQAQR